MRKDEAEPIAAIKQIWSSGGQDTKHRQFTPCYDMTGWQQQNDDLQQSMR